MRFVHEPSWFSLAAESIHYQNSKVFEGLVEVIKEVREIGRQKGEKIKDFYETGAVRKIAKYLEDVFEFETVKIFDGGPAAYLPQINQNHIFFNPWVREASADPGIDYDAEADIKMLMDREKKEKLVGGVDLRTAKLLGAYKKIPVTFLLPLEELVAKNYEIFYTHEEFAAVILHEVGHPFTTFEYVDRALTANQILQAMVHAQNSKIEDSKKEYVFVKAGSLIGMSEHDAKEAMKLKGEYALGTVVLNASIAHSVSELGNSVYDTNGCEALADQFAMRMGVGSHLATGLDKTLARYGQRSGQSGSVMMHLITSIIFVWLTVGTLGFFPILLIACASRENDCDLPKTRMTRLKLQLVERLKDRGVSEEERLTKSSNSMMTTMG
jgi:hypothetical protein